MSKFDADGLRHLGFDNFKEAFNVIGLALGVPPASIKNYRDEFDPLFPNSRQGWHKRTTREYCKTIYNDLKDCDMHTLSKILKQSLYKNPEIDLLIEQATETDYYNKDSSFAKRLVTGQAAEKYFINQFPKMENFIGYTMEDTTTLGCGFDFKLSAHTENFLAIEVKGINELHGTISLTQKEHSIAKILGERYYLFVVRNFKDSPFYELYNNPLSSDLSFSKTERKITQTTWSATL